MQKLEMREKHRKKSGGVLLKLLISHRSGIKVKLGHGILFQWSALQII